MFATFPPTGAVVELGAGLLNRNYFGTHFGGSLFAMTDPFPALLLIHRLGSRYHVWDQSANIEFVSPGRGMVSATFRLAQDTIEAIRVDAASGRKVLPEFRGEVRDRAGELVARVSKTIYVRLKPPYRPSTQDDKQTAR